MVGRYRRHELKSAAEVGLHSHYLFTENDRAKAEVDGLGNACKNPVSSSSILFT